MDEFASSPDPRLPSVYEIAGLGDKLFSRGQIVGEVSAGRMSPDARIREQGATDWIAASSVLSGTIRSLPSSPHVLQASEPTLWKRACGYLLDAFVIGVPVSILAIGGTLITVWVPGHDNIDLLLYVSFVSLGGLAGVAYLIFAPITPLRATLGMYALGLELRDGANQPIGLRTSIVRFLAAFCISGIFGIGYLWAFVDCKRRTFHDLLAGTHVVSVRLK